MTTSDHRLAARQSVLSLIQLLTSAPNAAALTPLVEECQALERAIGAFHMEGIRFRMFNVERAINRGDPAVPGESARHFADARRELEAAGFHTRSHQAPG